MKTISKEKRKIEKERVKEKGSEGVKEEAIERKMKREIER
jgi:hypothetical protein